MEKCCGNCRHWIKLHPIKGICEPLDAGWVNSDSGAHCDLWKRKRDRKPRDKLLINSQLIDIDQ